MMHGNRTIKTFMHIAMALSLTLGVRAELRIWASLPGTPVQAEYVKIVFDDVILKDENGEEFRIPLASFSGEDLKFIEMANPPVLSVDVMRSAKQKFVPTSPFLNKSPLNLLMYEFGARVKQKDAKTYPYPLTVEVYAFTQQRYDQSKYHLIHKSESEPFVLSKENERRYEYTAPNKVRIISYEMSVDYLNWTEERGEKFAESLILVRDGRGEIIAYNTTKNWLYDHLEKLEKLPFGAWLTDKCVRTHPTVPKSTKKPGVDWL